MGSERATADVLGSRAARFAHGLPEDRDLPGLGAALDADTMADHFNRHLLCGAAVCRCVRLVRFRYRAGERLIVVYDVHLDSRAADMPEKLVVTGRINPRRSLRLKSYHKQASETDGGTTPAAARSAALPQAAIIPEIGMLAEVFPEDRRMRDLATMADPQSDAVRALLRNVPWLEDDAAGRARAELVRYRPGLSATFRITTGDVRPPCPSQLFLKVTSDDDLVQEVTVAQRINALLKLQSANLRMAEPATWNREQRAALYVPARGEPLDRIICSGGMSTGLAQTVADCLTALHTLQGGALPATFDGIIAERIERASRLIIWALPHLGADVGVVARMAARLGQAHVRAPTHRDMKPDHLFIDVASGGMELIDCGSLCQGNPVADLGSMLVRLEHMAHREGLDVREVSRFADAIAEAYFASVPGEWRESFEPARAFAALLVGTHGVQGLVEDWRALVERTITTARARAESIALGGMEGSAGLGLGLAP